jgi:transglutaminase-like putative cysteine protease
MRFDVAFRLASYALVAVGLLALSLSEQVSPLVLGVGFLWLPLAWRITSRPDGAASAWLARMPGRGWTALVLALGFLSILRVLLLGGELIVATVEFLVAIQLIRVVSVRVDRDWFQIYAISFFQLLAASTLSESLGFAVSFLLFMLLATWSFLALHLREELASQPPGEAVVARRLLSLPFVATTSVVALATVVFTLGIFFTLPRVGRGFFQRPAPNPVKLSGFSDSVRLGELGEIKLDPTVVMRVRAPAPESLGDAIRFWRGSAFDVYDGQSWIRSTNDRRHVGARADGTLVLAQPTGTRPRVTQVVLLEPTDTPVLFAGGRPLSVEILGAPGRRFPFLHRDGMDVLTAPWALGNRVEYVVVAEVDRPSAARLRAAPPPTGRAVARYLALPTLSPRVAALAVEVTRSASTAYDRALAIERHLRSSYEYALDVRPTPGVPPLEDFLFTTRRGHCEYSATAMAVMLRTVGIPSRLVSGFLRGQWNAYGGYYVVRQAEAHTWVEAYFPGSGWVAFDPTPPAGTGLGLLAPFSALAQYIDALQTRWNRWIVGYTLADQVSAARAAAGGTRAAVARAHAFMRDAKTSLRAAMAHVRALEVPAWVAWPSLALLAVIVLRGRALVRRTGAFAYLERRRSNREILGLYARAAALAAARGVPRAAAQTAREHATLAAAAGLPCADRLAAVTRLYEAVRFGGHRATAADVRAARAALADLRAPVGRGGVARTPAGALDSRP